MGGRHARARPPAAPAAVRARLEAYAARGVFRGLSEDSGRGGRSVFRFLWLAPTPFTLTYAPATGVLVFRDLLPNVPARSPVGTALRRFVETRGDDGLPAHRRIDPRRARARCVIRRGALSLEVTAARRHHGYGVHRAVTLVHEIFVQLHTYFPEYMWENFHAPEE